VLSYYSALGRTSGQSKQNKQRETMENGEEKTLWQLLEMGAGDLNRLAKSIGMKGYSTLSKAETVIAIFEAITEPLSGEEKAYIKMSTAELYAAAKANAIDGRGSMAKNELIVSLIDGVSANGSAQKPGGPILKFDAPKGADVYIPFFDRELTVFGYIPEKKWASAVRFGAPRSLEEWETRKEKAEGTSWHEAMKTAVRFPPPGSYVRLPTCPLPGDVDSLLEKVGEDLDREV